MQLFYFSAIPNNATSFALDKEESRHIVKVLRKQEGDIIHLTDGKGNLYTCSISEANQNHCMLNINEVLQPPKTRNYRLEIGLAPTKSNDRSEWFLEKATEIGIDAFSFLRCENSERKVIKTDRFEKVVLSAMKQSLQFFLPQVKGLQDFNKFVSEATHAQKFIAHCYNLPKKDLWEAMDVKAEETLLLIGPEGDFSEEEVQFAIDYGFIPVRLSPHRLRTETAALVAVHQVSLKYT